MVNEPENKAKEPEPPKIKAEDNPWYLLATLYGVPVHNDHEMQTKNRVAWNRFFAANLDYKTRTELIEENRDLAEELHPFRDDELQEIAMAFNERCKEFTHKPALPASNAPIDFSRVDFEHNAVFHSHLFSADAVFSGAIFSGRADFGDAVFTQGAFFDHRVTFFGEARFGGATFSHWASFGDATFSDLAFFVGTTFLDVTNFSNASFGGTCNFVNAEMRGETLFQDAKFDRRPPRFFGAKLHQGTVWRGIKPWPLPKDKKDAGAFIDAYACLKLEMDRLKKHEDELDFFALELQCRRVLLGARSLESWVIAIYGLISNYGRSYFKPFVALIVVAVMGAAFFWYFDARTVWEALGLGAANTFNVFGFRGDFNLAIETPFAWLKILAAFQTILGTILLFLIGLGIRNKFRMK
jgi:uncharacterized protein YjbI with pentapeptide repeats